MRAAFVRKHLQCVRIATDRAWCRTPAICDSAGTYSRSQAHRDKQVRSLPPLAALTKELNMLHYAVVFLVIALIAAVFGFGGIAAGAVGIAKILFFVFVIMAVVTFVISLVKRG